MQERVFERGNYMQDMIDQLLCICSTFASVGGRGKVTRVNGIFRELNLCNWKGNL